MCGGCNDSEIEGTYSVVEIDKTLAAIQQVPPGFSKEMSLEQYRDHIRKQYAAKNLKLTSTPPHAFITPVPLEGLAQGLFTGGWARDTKDPTVVLLYEWASGSVYSLWGRATSSNAVLTVALSNHGTNPPVLYIKKTKRGTT